MNSGIYEAMVERMNALEARIAELEAHRRCASREAGTCGWAPTIKEKRRKETLL